MAYSILCKPSRCIVLALCMIVITACTPSYVNRENLGANSTADEITRHLSGNSILIPNDFGSTELYFGPDGTLKMVALGVPTFGIGTWRVDTAFGSSLLTLEDKVYEIQNDKVVQSRYRASVTVYIQPNGEAKLDALGGKSYSWARPTPEFQSASRWNSLLRQAGI